MNINFLLILLFLWIPPTAFATKIIDQTNRSEAESYEIHFCYRPSPKFLGIPGHAYVGFWKSRPNSSDVHFRAFGATTSGITDIFDEGGYISPEYQSVAKQDCLIVKVNSDKYKAAWASVKPLFSEPEYSLWNYKLADKTCVDFALSVANTLGLNSEDKVLPKNFILRLKELN